MVVDQSVLSSTVLDAAATNTVHRTYLTLFVSSGLASASYVHSFFAIFALVDYLGIITS